MLIAVGEWLFGLTPFGWRFAVAVVGSLSILMLARITRRMTSSTLLGCIAGLLMALDGLELVLSRTAILDIFVMFWVLAAFGLLVLDRDRRPSAPGGLAAARPAPRRGLAGGGPKLGIRWLRVLAGRLPGLRGRVQVEWRLVHARLRRAWRSPGTSAPAGPPAYRNRLYGVLRSDVKWLPVSFGRGALRRLPRVLERLVRHASSGYDRNWAALHGNHVPIWSTLDSLVPVQEMRCCSSAWA